MQPMVVVTLSPLFPGDGIGPEMFQQVRHVVDVMGVPINFEEVNVTG